MSDARASSLITGAANGVGRYLHEQLGGTALTRGNAEAILAEHGSSGFDTIIHCAFNRAHGASGEQAYDYLNDNLLLTHRLLQLPHRQFIYFSSVDVYPKGASRRNHEDDVLELSSPGSFYGMLKLMSESLVNKLGSRPLILRPASMLGPYTRSRTLSALLDSPEPRISLTASSTLNFVAYADVWKFIQMARAHQLTGTFNLTMRRNLSVADLATFLGKEPRFGEFRYDVGENDNTRASHWLPALARGSEETLLGYLGEGQGLSGGPCYLSGTTMLVPAHGERMEKFYG